MESRAQPADERGSHSAYEYVRGDAHTNAIEGYWAMLKRGINGVTSLKRNHRENRNDHSEVSGRWGVSSWRQSAMDCEKYNRRARSVQWAHEYLQRTRTYRSASRVGVYDLRLGKLAEPQRAARGDALRDR
jgi:hypothetical protein